jgi:protein-S-isoprenylcysteine O-methyltransferase Ste14
MSLDSTVTGQIGLLALLVAGAFLVFAPVRADYQTHGRLRPFTSAAQLGYFVVYALSSYAFLDSRLSRLATSAWFFPLAVLMMLVGLLMVLFSMPILGLRSFGRQVGKLHTSGLYRYTRNPQLLGGFLFMLGYALLWPSWAGAAWVAVWLLIAHLMTGAEEEHLRRRFGEAYRLYAARTPRYLGQPRL